MTIYLIWRRPPGRERYLADVCTSPGDAETCVGRLSAMDPEADYWSQQWETFPRRR